MNPFNRELGTMAQMLGFRRWTPGLGLLELAVDQEVLLKLDLHLFKLGPKP
jgi:hypothetical protein